MRKLLLLDLDGTLLGHKESISECNLKALKDFYNLDEENQVVITTGRSPKSIPHILSKIENYCDKKMQYVSCLNGAYIYNFHKNEVLLSSYINESVAFSIIDFLFRNRIGAIFYSCDNSVVDAHTTTLFSNLLYKFFGKTKTKLGKDIPKNVSKITVISSSRKVKKISTFIQKHFIKSVNISFNNENNIEIAPAGISKKSSYYFLNEIMKYEPSNVWAFGDQSNDYELLSSDINSVSMASAKKEIREVAKYVTNKEVKQENQVGDFINERIIKDKKIYFSVDLDGTLLNKDLSIDQETIQSLKKAVSLGHSIFINTGRPLSEAIDFFKMLNIEGQKYISACNGAILYSLEKKDYIYSRTFDRTDVINIFKSSLNNNHKFIFYFISSDSKQHKIDSMSIKELEKNDLGNVNKIIIKSESISPEIELQFQVSHMEPDFYEITLKGVSKSLSCSKVAEIENLSASDFVAIGDSLNDLSHISWAGKSWAVSNAVEEIKNIATRTSNYSNSRAVKDCIDNEI